MTRKYEQKEPKPFFLSPKKQLISSAPQEVLVSADFLDITKLVLETLNARKKEFKLPDDISKIEN